MTEVPEHLKTRAEYWRRLAYNADRMRGPMEIRDVPKLADWQLVDAVSLLRRLLDPKSEVDGAGFVGITPEDIRIDTFVALSEAEAEYLLRLRGFDDDYIDRFFSR